jgi:hypothetical protein
MGHEHRTGVPLKSGDEYDALTRWRKLIRFRPGVRKAAKTIFNRRVRRCVVEVDDDDLPEDD